jgi:hypothetical protein
MMVSPEILLTLALAFGFAALILGFDWLFAQLDKSPRFPAE